jgi:hypothetical protein
MDGFISLLRLLQGWLTSPETMWTFLIGLALLLVSIFEIQHKSVADLLDKNLSICMVTVVCVAGLIVHYAYKTGSVIKRRYRLRHLAEDEKKILAKFVQAKQSTVPVFFNELGAESLLDDGILKVTSEIGRVHQDVGCTYYTIKHSVLRTLIKNPSLVLV